MAEKINLLVNLTPGFYRTAAVRPLFARMEKIARVRKRWHTSAEVAARDLAWADAAIMWSLPPLTHALLDKAPRLRFIGELDISRSSARVALERGLAVSVTRRAWAPAVAEMALGLILAALRRIPDYNLAMHRARETWFDWPAFPSQIDPMERQLSGRPVGIIGFGAVGRRLAELLRPFGCQLRVCDPHVPESALGTFGAVPAGLDDLMCASDVVVISACSSPDTRHLVGRRQISAMRKGAVLVNVARAAIVDTDALVARLKRGDIIAAIDVFDSEPLGRSHPLRRLANAYLTPHRAGGVMESVNRIVGWAIDDLEAHLAGRPLAHPLTWDMIESLDG